MDRNAAASLLAKTGRGVILPMYDEAVDVASSVATVRTIDAASGYEGRADDVMEEMGELRRRADGQAMEVDRPGRVGIAGVAFHKFGRQLKVPIHQMRAIMESPNPEARLVDYLGKKLRDVGEEVARNRSEYFTQMLEKGVLAAGNSEFFDNSYAGFDDPNAGFVYDGKAWFATDHPLRDGSTKSNIITSNALNAANLNTARIRFSSTNAVNHRGRKVKLMPDILLVPPELENVALQLSGSTLLPGSPNNDINPEQGRYRVVVNPYLATTAGWFLLKRGWGTEIWSSGAPEIETDYDPKTREFLLNVELHTGGRVINWRGGVANNLATS